MRSSKLVIVLVLTGLTAAACARRQPPIAAPPRPPVVAPPSVTAAPPPPPQRVEETLPVPQQPLSEDTVGNRSLDDLNRDSPFRPVFFPLDSSDLDDMGRGVAQANADLMKKYGTWVVTVEGHCDERGTAEYNLALGERRAKAAMNYLVSNGVEAGRITTISYGKERPVDPASNEAAWAKNRNGHTAIVSGAR